MNSIWKLVGEQKKVEINIGLLYWHTLTAKMSVKEIFECLSAWSLNMNLSKKM